MEDKVSVCLKTTEDGTTLRESVRFEEGTLLPDEVMLVGRVQANLMARRGEVEILEEGQKPAEHPKKKRAARKKPPVPSVLD